MTGTDKVVNPQHFGSNPADIGIQISPEIWIRILHHLWLRLDALVEICTFWA